MGPRWKGKDSKAKALADPMSNIVSRLSSSLIQLDARGLLSGYFVSLAVKEEQTELLTRACFGRPTVTGPSVTAEKDQQWLLDLQEAFYLCHSLKCLKIVGEDNFQKNDVELWHYMKSKNANFPNFYKAYSHLRIKNWVVRPGSQYGGDFVAYRHHPSLVHSEYVVVVLSEKNDDLNVRFRVWPDLESSIRVCGGVAKTLLTLNIYENGHGADSPSCLERYSVVERTITRWSPEQNRENQTNTENGTKKAE